MAHPDLDQLLDSVLPFAQQMLAKHGEFYPFGSSMALDGSISGNAAYDGNEHPPSQPLIDLMTKSFRQSVSEGNLRAACICFDVRTIPPGQTDKTDAICVALEHCEGQYVDVFLPYMKGWFGKFQYGDLYASQRTPQFFV